MQRKFKQVTLQNIHTRKSGVNRKLSLGFKKK